MKTLRRTRFTRLIFALALGALSFVLGAPQRVSANTCGFRAHYVYYAEPEKINVVGTCDRYCGNHPSSCTGTITPYSTTTFNIECTFC